MKNSIRWYDNMQYAAMWLAVCSIPLNWRLALWMSLLLLVATVVKMVAGRHVGNPSLSRPLRWALCTPMVYWGVLALSLLWSTDAATGLAALRLKAVMLVWPLCLLLSDTSYLTSRHLRGLGYALLLGLGAAFAYFAAKAGGAMLDGMSLSEFQNAFFGMERRDAGRVYHHAYIALYAVVALVFVYHDLATRWNTMRPWLRWLLILAVPILICYVVVVNSRAGMLAMGLAGLACVVHLAVTHRSWKLGLGIGLLLVVGVVAATRLVPSYSNRIASTLENVESDARTDINRSNWHAYCQSPLLGYGVGDYRARQVEQYGADDFDYGANASYNAHNQYMESLMAAGIPGILALLMLLLAPVVVAWRQRSAHRFLVVMITVIVMFNLLFESMLERQMGLLFVAALVGVMTLILSVEKNKFAQSEKK